MNLSYWEQATWLENIDIAIIGSGIVGLFCALEAKKKFPKSKIVVFERGVLPSGASTKNAGFACFGSVSEIVHDLKSHTEIEVQDLVALRREGLQILNETLGSENMGYHLWGGYELFLKENPALFYQCTEQMEIVNELLLPIFKEAVFSEVKNIFDFENCQSQLILNKFEAQIHTGKMMQALIKKAISNDIYILNNAEISNLETTSQGVEFSMNGTQRVTANQVCVATNGFAKSLLDIPVTPARAQVLITKPIENLKIKGTFHMDEGYYYFRNIDNRVLLGGGRNLDFIAEETTEMVVTERIQTKLKQLLKEVILPNTPFEVEQSWSGIMGIGTQKTPIVKEVAPQIYCGVRLGGMGVAIGSIIGKKLAQALPSS